MECNGSLGSFTTELQKLTTSTISAPDRHNPDNNFPACIAMLRKFNVLEAYGYGRFKEIKVITNAAKELTEILKYVPGNEAFLADLGEAEAKEQKVFTLLMRWLSLDAHILL